MISVAALLPWWLSLILAVLAYLGFHWLAQPAAPVPAGSAADLAGSLQGMLIRMFSTLAQYLAPLVLLCGAVLSVLSNRKRRGILYGDNPNIGPVGIPKNWDPELDRRAADLRSSLAERARGSMPGRLDSPHDVGLLLDLIEWRRFESAIEVMYQQQGYTTTAQSHGADGGVDIKLFRNDTPGVLAGVVQCKHWGKRSVGVEVLRALRGSRAELGAPHGFLVTSSSFSSDALKFAAGNQIEAIGRKELMARILALPPAQRESIRTTALLGEYQVPTCASCGTKMVKRTPRKGGQAFWGCVNYPRCRSVIQIPRSS